MNNEIQAIAAKYDHQIGDIIAKQVEKLNGCPGIVKLREAAVIADAREQRKSIQSMLLAEINLPFVAVAEEPIDDKKMWAVHALGITLDERVSRITDNLSRGPHLAQYDGPVLDQLKTDIANLAVTAIQMVDVIGTESVNKVLDTLNHQGGFMKTLEDTPI